MNKTRNYIEGLNLYLDIFEPNEQEELVRLSNQERVPYISKILGKSEESITEDIAVACGMEVKKGFRVLPDFKLIFPIRLIHEYQCLPIQVEDTDSPQNGEEWYMHLVTPWPLEASADKWIYAVCGKRPKWYLGYVGEIVPKITDHFGVGFYSLESSDLERLEEVINPNQEAETEDQDAAIIKFVNEIIVKAIEDRATDIHFEPMKNALQIRNRIDGELIPVQVPDQLIRFQAAIISRLKIMARLNISERRRPQDGRIKFVHSGREADIRVSTFPTNFGESVSLRLLSQGGQSISTISEIGFLPEDEKKIEPSIKKPHGIILVTGPTGSGKSTTLSTFIRMIRSPERRIITVEDPIENEIPGVNQTQVHGEIGLTFANSLRYILRQDPDVIMVGEIRDKETADIAIRASLTGHLVLSTLHTNDAAGAITRLIDMEIEPFLLASSLEMVIAQRLVRRLCPHCSRPAVFKAGEVEQAFEALGVEAEELNNVHLAKEAVGCPKCHNLGYRGRVGIFEVLHISEKIHKMIVQQMSAKEMREQAIREGMRTLQQCGWEQVKRGLTSLGAILKYAEITAQN